MAKLANTSKQWVIEEGSEYLAVHTNEETTSHVDSDAPLSPIMNAEPSTSNTLSDELSS